MEVCFAGEPRQFAYAYAVGQGYLELVTEIRIFLQIARIRIRGGEGAGGLYLRFVRRGREDVQREVRRQQPLPPPVELAGAYHRVVPPAGFRKHHAVAVGGHL